jgi:hypothetical protein
MNVYKKIRRNPLSLSVDRMQNRGMKILTMKKEDEKPIGRDKVKELISILLESSFYLTIPLKERYTLIRMIIEKHQFLSHRDDKSLE